MGKYYQAIRLETPDQVQMRRAGAAPAPPTRDLHAIVPQLLDSGALVPRPVFPEMPASLPR
jgi:hypothetical protein